MFWQIAWFELRFWLRSWLPWTFLLVIGGLVFGAVSTDQVTLGGGLSNTYRNAPFVIQNYYAFVCMLTLLMCAAFVIATALRDFTYNTHQMVFSTSLRRRDFLLARFASTTLISVIPMLGVSLGVLLAKYMPWVDPERWAPVSWTAHLNGILIFALPNSFFMAAILFAAAVLFRRDMVCFIVALLMLTGFVLGDVLLQNLQHENLAAMVDPFAIRTFDLATKYWTVAEKNTQSVGLDGVLLWNRLLWVAAGCLAFAFAYFRFSFAERRVKSKARVAPEPPPAAVGAVFTSGITLRHSSWAKLLGSTRLQFLGIVKSNFFLVVAIAALLNCVPSLLLDNSELLGNHAFPVTYWVIEVIHETLFLFLIIVITYYAGVLASQDQEERVDEIIDATPTPDWIRYASRLGALLAAVMLIQFFALTSGIAAQAWQGYHRYQIDLYVQELVIRDGSEFILMSVLAFFVYTLVPNKYVGYAVYIAVIFANLLIWRPLNIATYMVRFAQKPEVIYSDFFGDAPYRAAWNWFTLYWLLFSALLAVATVMFWPRGKDRRWSARARNASSRFTFGWRAAAAGGLLAFASCGAWTWHNTKVLNQVRAPKDEYRLLAEYERTYKRFEGRPMPRIRRASYEVDLFPSSRNMEMRGQAAIYNPHSYPLDEVHFSVDRNYDTSIDIPGATLVSDDERLFYRMYQFTTALQPGEERAIQFTLKSKNQGFENGVSNPWLVQNGTFFNNVVAPWIGYTRRRELPDPVERKKYGLPEIDLMPVLQRDCRDGCQKNYIGGHADWVDVSTVISTEADQIAVAPGSLVREWQHAGRRYFEYRLDRPSVGYLSFTSGRYEVAREEWKGITLEVYHLKEHPWNVPRMMNSMKKSLDYYVEHFGPYAHKNARIIEFARVADVASAYPGTMPYSESLGFIANLNDPDNIDSVFYLVAHEMAHQWWVHQVIGADMAGATFLSETLAQYSALMVMEKEYGRDMMRKFLKYEMDQYLRSRGQERLKERPLLTVESNQEYIHYHKGSVAFYYLKEMIGEDAVNRALRTLIRRYAYAPPPYPTAYALVDAMRAETPASLHYLIKDLFEDITLFSNRTLQATARKRRDGKYDVTVDVQARKFKADAKGHETEVPVDDWMEIGAFAKPAAGRRYGDTLYRQRVHLTRRDSTFTFTTSELPEQAGIDPFVLLIDRVPDDNLQRVTPTPASPASPASVDSQAREVHKSAS